MLTTRTMIILSAVAATGIVFITEPSHGEQTFGVEHVKVQDRYPGFNIGAALRGALDAERNGVTAPAPESTPKADKLDTVADCNTYTWPKIPTACLDLADDGAKQDTRQVQVINRPSERISFVTTATTIVAQR
jgi:hypothetical protein